jgi:hypothetical protein
MDRTSAVGGYGDGVLGCTTDAGQITVIAGWNFYAGSDTTQIGAGQYDFQTIAMHELGHALGLGHSADPSSVMYATLQTGLARRHLSVPDLAIPDLDNGPCGLHVSGWGGSGQEAASDSGNLLGRGATATANPGARSSPPPVAVLEGRAPALVVVPGGEVPGIPLEAVASGGPVALVGGDGDQLVIGAAGRDVLVGGFASDSTVGNEAAATYAGSRDHAVAVFGAVDNQADGFADHELRAHFADAGAEQNSGTLAPQDAVFAEGGDFGGIGW